MSRDLTSSAIDRKNILTNNEAIKIVYDNLGFQGVMFEGRYRFTRQQVATFYEVDPRTILRLLESHAEELAENGYEIFRGEKLKNLRQAFLMHSRDVYDIHVTDMAKVSDNEIFIEKLLQIGKQHSYVQNRPESKHTD